jgi:Ca2+-binding EF-hand superfamily protein
VAFSGENSINQEIGNAVEQSILTHSRILEEDVKPAFKKFDRDGNGFIDKGELI